MRYRKNLANDVKFVEDLMRDYLDDINYFKGRVENQNQWLCIHCHKLTQKAESLAKCKSCKSFRSMEVNLDLQNFNFKAKQNIFAQKSKLEQNRKKAEAELFFLLQDELHSVRKGNKFEVVRDWFEQWQEYLGEHLDLESPPSRNLDSSMASVSVEKPV